MKIQGFLLDECPNFGEESVELTDESKHATKYSLRRVKGNGCILTVLKNGAEIDQITYSPQDLRALYLLLHVNRK